MTPDATPTYIEHRRRLSIPPGTIVRLPNDVLALAEDIATAVSDNDLRWEIDLGDEEVSGIGIASLGDAISELFVIPNAIELRGWWRPDARPPGQIDGARVSLGGLSYVTVYGSERNWVAGVFDKLKKEVEERLPPPRVPWWRRWWASVGFVLDLIASLAVFAILQAVTREPIYGFLAAVIFSVPLAYAITGFLRGPRWSGVRFLLPSSSAADLPNRPTALAVARASAPLVSAAVAVISLALVLSDRCTRA
jgi:hypothetical protein